MANAESLAEKISERVDNLIEERNILRRELARKSDGGFEAEAAFVCAYRAGVIEGAYADEAVFRLERMLKVR